MDITKRISSKLQLQLTQVNSAIRLIDEGNTIPFIARYRKEITNNLTDNELRSLAELLTYLRALEARMETIVTAISEQGKLTADIETAINNVSTLAELEDIYRPYKPKRKTRIHPI